MRQGLRRGANPIRFAGYTRVITGDNPMNRFRTDGLGRGRLLSFAIACSLSTAAFATEPTPGATTIHVDTATGNDANPGTAALPRKTIGAGIAALAGGAGQVFVAQGQYDEIVSLTGGASLFGQFEASNWTRRYDRET